MAWKRGIIEFSSAKIVALLILLTGSAFANQKCDNIFLDNIHPIYGYERGRTEQLFSSKYESSYTDNRIAYFSKPIPTNDSVYDAPVFKVKGVVHSRYYPLRESWTSSEFYQFQPTPLTHFESHSKTDPKSSESPVATQRFDFKDFVVQNIDFVLAEYQSRREWSSSFRDHLYKDAFKFAEQSVYFNVREKRNLIGTMKLVFASDQTNVPSLPMEEYLKIHLESNHGLKVEPSNFSILKEKNKTAFPELLLQFVSYAQELLKSGKYDPEKPIFYTYGDALSLRLYSGMGFHLVGKTRDHEGKEWNILASSLNDIVNLPNFIRASRSDWHEDFREGFLRFLDIYQQNRTATAHDSWTSNVKIFGSQFHFSEVSFRISEEHKYKGRTVKLLEVFSKGDSQIDSNWLMESNNNRLSPILDPSIKRQSINIENKTITYEKDYSYFKIKIKIYLNDDLIRPKKLFYQQLFRDKNPNFESDDISFEMDFN